MILPATEKVKHIKDRLLEAIRHLKSCQVCPRQCRVNRIRNEIGFCGMGYHPVVSSDNLHFGEEPPISGHNGSGTIFFTGCNLGCVFCQNYPISQLGQGNSIRIVDLAKMMLHMQKRGAHNINLVTPTHFGPQIMAALYLAYQKGLRLPVVYNCGGYESREMLDLWDGIIDIYMPDMKYHDEKMAEAFSNAKDYPQVNRDVVTQMHRQVGDLRIDENGIAQSGLLVRHLVLPENVSGTELIMQFIAERISKETFISLMSQYFPAHKAVNMQILNRRVSDTEYFTAKKALRKYNLQRGWVQNNLR